LVSALAALVLAASCASAPAHDSASVRETLAARADAAAELPAAPVQASEAPEAYDRDKVGLSDSRRLAPPSMSVMVLGLPEPQPVAINPPRLDPQPGLKTAEARREASVVLAEPVLPERLATLPEIKPAALVGSAQTAATKTATVPAKPAVKTAATPSASAETASPGAGSAAKAQTKPAPAAPTPAPPSAAAPEAATKEALPSAPPSLAPWIDMAKEQAAPVTRAFSVVTGDKVEIPFDGTNWTYLGERDGKAGVLYDSRRFEGRGALFTIMTNKPGDFSLRFMRQDLERGTTSEEIVRLSVSPRAATTTPTGSDAVPLPASPAAQAQPAAPGTPVAPAASAPAASPAASQPPGAALAASAPAPDSPDGLLATARSEYAASRVAGALAALDRFLSLYPAGEDEVYWLYGQTLELNSPLRDVKQAMAMYKKLLADWPRSAFWNQAQDRVSYIERHYLDIR
jgi:hypothetical protein